MTGPLTFIFTCGLLFFCGLCYFGVRRDRAPWSIFAIIAVVCLAPTAGVYLGHVARLWAGKSVDLSMIGGEVIMAIVFVAWRHRYGWISERRVGRKAGRIKGPIGRRHAGG